MKTEQGHDTTDTFTTTISGEEYTLDVDLMQFAHHLDDSDYDDEEKQEFLGIFWNLVVAFVDLGYGVNSTQMACGHLTKSFEKEGVLALDSVQLEQAKTTEEGACS